MMSNDNWIEIEGNLEESDHVMLKIAGENLNDLNLRLKNELPVIYNVEKSKFEPSDYTDSANYDVVDVLNKYVNWLGATGKDRDFQIRTYLRGVENVFRQLKTDLHYIQLTNSLNDNHLNLIHSFIARHEMFSPKGIISKDELISIQKKLNSYCQELRMEFLNEREGEWFLDFGTENVEIKVENTASKSYLTQQWENLYAFWMLISSKLFKTNFRPVKVG